MLWKHAKSVCWLGVLAGIVVVEGQSPDLGECTRLLQYNSVYLAELDDPVQLAALLEFQSSTGGSYWSYDLPVNSTQHSQFDQLVDELEVLGNGVAEDYLNISSLDTDTASDMSTALTTLSANCALQQWLTIGHSLLKHEWGTPGVSYCEWSGVTCCQSSGDLLNQFCSSPQSVAQLYLQGMNLSGTIPSNFLVAMQDLQSFVISDNLNLRGRVPLASATVASRISELRLSNTSLEQCSSSHLTALQNHKGESVVHAGDSSTMAADNLTHCLPNVWQFCGPEGGPVTHITCPSVAFLRPPVTPISNLYKLRNFLGILSDTHSLVAASANISTPVLEVGPAAVTPATFGQGGPGGPGGPTHPQESRPGRAPGGLPPPDGRPPFDEAPPFNHFPPPPMQGCSSEGFLDRGSVPSQGLGSAGPQIDYDDSFFSFVGCRCDPGYDNVYTINEAGHVTLECELLNAQRDLRLYVGLAVAGAMVLLLFLMLLAFRGRQIISELANARLNRVKRGHKPGTLRADQAQDLGLIHKEVTLVLTDVQASSSLWEWNHKVMEVALDMHDRCLRSVLQKHYGYEVSTEGDAFTMAFHDPIDACGWALEIQHKLLTLPWPPELLTQTDACEQRSPAGVEGDELMFKGLRVRVAIHTGQPDSIQVNHVTRQVEYKGELVSLTEALVGFPSGGQMLISGATYQRLYGRLPNISFNDYTAASSKLSALRQPAKQSGSLTDAAALQDAGGSLDTRFASELALQAAALPPRPSIDAFGTSLRGSSSLQLLVPSSPTLTADDFRRSDSLAASETEFGGCSPISQPQQASTGRRWRLQALWGAIAKLAPCFVKKQLAGPAGSIFRPWGSAQQETSSSMQLTPEKDTECVLVDTGMFHLVEFANTLCLPYVGSAVHGGIHMLQLCPRKLSPRMLMVKKLDATRKVAPTFADAPGVIREAGNLPRSLDAPNCSNLEATLVFCCSVQYKELLLHNVSAAESALRTFQSCVRTTLLLSSGYECQEKDGSFMLAFEGPRGAIEWAVLLQFALLRADWGPALEREASTAEIKSASGQTLFKGFTSKVALMHGSLTKVCPHVSTGRADYFGPLVNKTSRLLSAAKPGQILVEAPTMELVLQQWRGERSSLDRRGQDFTAAGAARTKGAALLQAGMIAIPDVTDAGELSPSPRIKSAPQLDRTLSHQSSLYDTGDGTGRGMQRMDSGIEPASAALGRQSSVAKQKGWAVPHSVVRTPAANNRASKPSVTFASGHSNDRPTSGMSKMFPQRRPSEGVTYTDAELEELEELDATCQPVAASSPLAVSNCHMLKFLAQYGRQQGRRESLIGPKSLQGPSNAATTLSYSPELSQASLPASIASKTGHEAFAPGLVNSNLSGNKRPPSFLDPRQREASRPVWTPGSVKGQSFGTVPVGVEVWGIGAFAFKHIQGHSKVMEVQPAELSERREYHTSPLEPGKASCLLAACYRRCMVNIQLMDVLDLQLSL